MSSSIAPTTGAAIGASPLTSIRMAKNRVSSGPSATSRAMARAMTMPLAPLKPCRKRNTRKAVMCSDRQAPALAAVKTSMPSSRGSLRPKRSESGPMKICPKAMPSIVMVKVSCVSEADIPKSPPSSGKAGKYISVESGAIAVMMPRNTVKNNFCLGLNCKRIFLSQIVTCFLIRVMIVSVSRRAGCRRAPGSYRGVPPPAQIQGPAKPAASRASAS